MTRRHVVAVLVAVAAMMAVLGPPLWRLTGDEVTLAIQPVDPLSLFRGNYVDLRYDVELPQEYWNDNGVIYAVFADERPGRLLRVTTGRPSLESGEFCLRGRADYRTLSFPQLEQFFVTPELGKEMERQLSEMVAVLKVTGRCSAVLTDLELLEPTTDSD